jgi:hypothetical protein
MIYVYIFTGWRVFATYSNEVMQRETAKTEHYFLVWQNQYDNLVPNTHLYFQGGLRCILGDELILPLHELS